MPFGANGTPLSRFLTSTTTLIMLTACGMDPALSVEPPTPGPAVWSLSDTDTTVYLFGYTQALKPGVSWQIGAFTAAFDAAETLILETEAATPENQGDMQREIQRLGFYADGRTLSNTLTQDQAEEINAISQNLGVPLRALDSMKPWLASMQLGVVAISSQGYDLENPPLTVMLKAATDVGKHVEYLESSTGLMAKIAGLDDTEQLGLLLHSSRTLRDDPEELARLNTAWLSGDVELIGQTLHGEDGAWSSDAVYSVMLLEQNEQWRKQISEIMDTKQGTYLIAVGLGHLAGEDSLVTMLSNAGYTVLRE